MSIRTIGYVILLVLLSACSSMGTPYGEASLGYKLNETDVYFNGAVDNSLSYKMSCTFELGMEKGQWSYGVRHLSQCFVGAPFDDRSEYYRNELFLGYKYYF